MRRSRPSCSFSAYGRAVSTDCCARRSLVADTSSIAFVICWMFLTLLMRRLISRIDCPANDVHHLSLAEPEQKPGRHRCLRLCCIVFRQEPFLVRLHGLLQL